MKRVVLGFLTVLAIVTAGIFLSGCLSIGLEADLFPGLQSSTLSGGAEKIRADWSSLTPYTAQAAQYRYYTPYSGSGELLPDENYGVLLPYIGAEVALSGHAVDALPLYGLVTADGQIVTEPVYTEILTSYKPFLLLYRAQDIYHSKMTVAARDGRWVRDAGDWREVLLLEDDTNPRLALSNGDGSVWILNADGSMAAEFTRDMLEPYLGTGYEWGDPLTGYIEGCALSYEHGLLTAAYFDEESPWGNYWRYECFMDPETGTVNGTPSAHWTPDNEWSYENPPEFEGYSYPEEVEDLVTGTRYYSAYPEHDGWDDDWTLDLLDKNGRALMKNCLASTALQWRPIVADGMLGAVRDGVFTYTQIATGDIMFRYQLHTNSD